MLELGNIIANHYTTYHKKKCPLVQFRNNNYNNTIMSLYEYYNKDIDKLIDLFESKCTHNKSCSYVNSDYILSVLLSINPELGDLYTVNNTKLAKYLIFNSMYVVKKKYTFTHIKKFLKRNKISNHYMAYFEFMNFNDVRR